MTEKRDLRLTRLPLDLLPSPPGGLLRTRRKFLIAANLTRHSRQPLVAEVVCELAAGESFGDITVIEKETLARLRLRNSRLTGSQRK